MRQLTWQFASSVRAPLTQSSARTLPEDDKAPSRDTRHETPVSRRNDKEIASSVGMERASWLSSASVYVRALFQKVSLARPFHVYVHVAFLMLPLPTQNTFYAFQ